MGSIPQSRPVRCARYLEWLRKQPCVVCRNPSEVARIASGDFMTVPMCHSHHQLSQSSFTVLGRPKFEDTFGVDLAASIHEHLIRFMVDVLGLADNK